MSKDELYAEAKRLNIEGRSKMTKAELENVIKNATGAATVATEFAERNVNAGADLMQALKDSIPPRSRVHIGKSAAYPTVDEAHKLVIVDPKEPRLPRGIEHLFDKSAPVTKRKLTKAIREGQSRYYGMRGRGMGAKHFLRGGVPGHGDIVDPELVRNAIVGRGLMGAR